MSAAPLRRSAVLAAATVLVSVLVTAAAGARSPHLSYAPSGVIDVGVDPCTFVVARFNRDDHLDVGITDCRSNSVTVLLGDGAGHFRRASSTPTHEHPSALAVADFNGDGNADLAVSNDRSKDVTVLFGDGAGGFAEAPGSPVKLGRAPGRLAAADINDDDRADLVVPAFPSRVAVLLGDGAGRFNHASGSPLEIVNRYGPERVTVADFSGDRKPDLAISTIDPMRITILLGDGTGGFRRITTVKAGLKDVGDFNGDGRPDLAVATPGASRTAPYNATVLLGRGGGRFSRSKGLPIRGQFWSTQGVAAELTGDRKLDLALVDDSGNLSMLRGDGRGRFRPAPDTPLPLPPFSYGFHLVVRDLNVDDRSDLLVAVRRVPERGGDSGLAILWNSPPRPLSVPRGSFPSARAAVFTTRASIWALAADGNRAAVVTAKGKPCGPVRIVVWTAPARRSRGFDDRCIGDAVTHIALGGGQVAWLQQGGGNSLELIVNAARLSGGKPAQIHFTTNGNRAGGDPRGGWLGQLLGEGALLAYNSWRISCDVPDGYGCDGPTPLIISDQQLVRIVGRRRVTVKRGRDSFALAAVGGGRMAVEAAGAISVLAPNGSRLATVGAVSDDQPRAFALSRTRLAVERMFTLDLYEPTTGRATKSIPLGPAAGLRLAGVNSALAVLRSPRRLIVVRLRDGKLISLALRTQSHVDARLTAAGLFCAYNVSKGRMEGRIAFEPTARLLARF
jgi:hypothetical protein